LADTFRTLRLDVDADGRWAVYVSAFGGGDATTLRASGQHEDLATGGGLEDGRVGLFDYASTAVACTRSVGTFTLSAPPTSEAYGAMFANQSVRFTYDRAERENSAGTRWGLAPDFTGEHLLIPPAGRGDRTSRIAVLARRFDIDDQQPSEGTGDSLVASLIVTPRVLLVPE
jgi:hypothetical protein